jgi:hypothetical protein
MAPAGRGRKRSEQQAGSPDPAVASWLQDLSLDACCDAFAQVRV